MNPADVNKLHERNKRIIDAVIKKAEKECPNSIALIGIYGSFFTKDIHQKSDLDLCIVINDDNGWKVHNCFILDDVAHDIYCTTWKELEDMTEYKTPQISKLLGLEIVYCAGDRYMDKFLSLRNKVQMRLNLPFANADIENVIVHFDNAMKEFSKLILADEVHECKYLSAKMICSIENVIYLINKEYIKKGIKHIPKELENMNILPIKFIETHHKLISATTIQEIKNNSTILMKSTQILITELKEKTIKRKELRLQDLKGSYEEIYSNWKNKMWYAAEINNSYLSFMTVASCQEFYDEMFNKYNIKRTNLMIDFNTADLLQSAKEFDKKLKEYKKLYEIVGEPIIYYTDITEFEQKYLN